MGDGVDKALEPGELGVLRHGLEPAVAPEELELPQHPGDEGEGPVDDLGDGPVERDVLGRVQPLAGLHLGPVEAEHAHARLREEGGRALAEEQEPRHGEAPVAHEAPRAEDLLVGGVRAEYLLVAGEDLAVHVPDPGVLDELVLEDALVLVVLERAYLLVAERLALVALPQEHRAVFTPSDDAVGRRLDVHDEHEVVLAGGVGDGHARAGDVGRRGAVGDGALLEALGVAGALAGEAGHGPVVLYAHYDLPARRVGEGHDVPGEVLWFDPRALAVEVVVLPRGGERLYVVRDDGALHPSTPRLLCGAAAAVVLRT